MGVFARTATHCTALQHTATHQVMPPHSCSLVLLRETLCKVFSQSRLTTYYAIQNVYETNIYEILPAAKQTSVAWCYCERHSPKVSTFNGSITTHKYHPHVQENSNPNKLGIQGLTLRIWLLHDTATHCNTLQYTASDCTILFQKNHP